MCIIWVHHLFAFQTLRPYFYMPHICLQVWVLPFSEVNKIVEMQIEVGEHLEKVHRRYITEILQHASEHEVFARLVHFPF